jgi:hypothetical protein
MTRALLFFDKIFFIFPSLQHKDDLKQECIKANEFSNFATGGTEFMQV